MIFQPNGGAGGGGGLTLYSGNFSNSETFKTPVKLVFVSYNSNVPLWFIILPRESKDVYGIANDTWPPERLGFVSLSANGKTLSTSSSYANFLYYAIG